MVSIAFSSPLLLPRTFHPPPSPARRPRLPPTSSASPPTSPQPLQTPSARPPPPPSSSEPAAASAAASAAPSATPSAAPCPSQPGSATAREEALVLLEWADVSARVARHASTALGRRHLLREGGMLEVPDERARSEALLALTRDAWRMEFVLARPLGFAGVGDVAGVVRGAEKGRVMDGRELVQVADTLKAARAVRRHVEGVSAGGGSGDEVQVDGLRARDRRAMRAMFASEDGEKSGEEGGRERLPALVKFVAEIRSWPEVEAEIRETVDDFGEVYDSCDAQLAGLRSAIKEVQGSIRERLMGLMAARPDAIQDRVITSRFDRFVIPVKMSHKGHFKRGVVHDMSATGSTAYIEPQAVRALNDKLRELAVREKARCQAVLRKLSVDVVAQTADDVEYLSSVLGMIDAACARSRASRSLDAVDVRFDDSAPMALKGARHPLLSWKAMDEAESTGKTWKEAVVPSDYLVDDGVRCVCVTGPNTGGKTISLKTLGVSVLMAKAGLFVPAKGGSGGEGDGKELLESEKAAKRANAVRKKASTARRWPQRGAATLDDFEDEDADMGDEFVTIPWFDNVLADIGDDQSLSQSLSTFSGHVQRMKRILMATTPQTLVLLDEVGSGTDPAEGAALGIALLKHLSGAGGGRRHASLTFATTHHGELKTLKYGTAADSKLFENASVEFDTQEMAPTFRLLWGIPGRSNALAIARRLGLHSGVISTAEELISGGDMGNGRVNVSKMIADLEQEKKAAELARADTEEAWTEVRTLRTELQSRLADLEESEENLREESRRILDKELQEAKKEISSAIRDMQKEGRSSRAAAEASSRVDAIREDSAPTFASTDGSSKKSSGAISVDSIEVGNRVTAPRLGPSSAEVVEVDIGKKEVTVVLGSMKVRVKVKELTNVARLQQRPSLDSQAAGSALAKKVAKKKLKALRSGGGSKLAVRTSANTVNVIGQRIVEAESSIDVALSRAIMSGKLWIVHGHGTGRLRSGVRSYLSQHSNVEKFEDGARIDGGSGVTVAYLR